MPILGNYNNSSDVLTYGLRRISAGEYAQEPSTHLIINLITGIDGLGTSTEEAIQCSGLRYRFSKSKETQETKGSYILPNIMSSFELWDYVWNGQLMTLGAQVDMRYVDTPFDSLYLPDESSFCEEASNSVFNENV